MNKNKVGIHSNRFRERFSTVESCAAPLARQLLLLYLSDLFIEVIAGRDQKTGFGSRDVGRLPEKFSPASRNPMTAEESSTADEKMPPNEAEVAAATAASKMDPETEPLNAGGDPKVKFIGGAESVDVEKGGVKADKDEVKGALTKAELMKYATDKKWVTTRQVQGVPTSFR